MPWAPAGRLQSAQPPQFRSRWLDRRGHCAGISSTAKAPSTAARIISGNARRKMIQKLLAYERTTAIRASPHVSAMGTSITQLTIGPGTASRGDMAGTKTSIKNSTVANFNKASGRGNNAQVIASTTTFKAGEENMAASTDSVLIPEVYMPRAMGAIQLLQTPNGMPATVPNNVFR